MKLEEVIENLRYLISENCTDTQYDYVEEIGIAIEILELQNEEENMIRRAYS
ncbi:MAG: hypothetical protein KBS82_05070 [Oscillospiraceae bacterium]|nr:hypothetical protein [Candidatus Limimonas egerieequi]